MDDAILAEQRVGRVLAEKWRLDRLLGVGGMAAVYAATGRNGNHVAVKVLHPSLCGSTDARQRFLSEGYAANRVGHPGALAVLDDDATSDGQLFLVMELLSGDTLETRWLRAGQRLPAVDVMAVTERLLEILIAAHSAGIVHRDIKPENIYLTDDGQVKLLDFGIARIEERTLSAAKTQAGLAMGTPWFMPPEQARGRWNEVDARSDLWAVGATMFTLLSGRYVHTGETSHEVLLSAMTAAAPPLASVCPDAPTGVAAIVDRALAPDPKDRWPSAVVMLYAVRSERAHASTPPCSVPVATRPAASLSASPLVWGLSSFVVVGLLVLAVLSRAVPAAQPAAAAGGLVAQPASASVVPPPSPVTPTPPAAQPEASGSASPLAAPRPPATAQPRGPLARSAASSPPASPVAPRPAPAAPPPPAPRGDPLGSRR